MKILVVADEPEKALWDYFDRERVNGVELIISCGDLSAAYLEFLETMINRPLLYVRGNHDTQYDYRAPQGCIDIDDRVYDYRGLRILGLGGSMCYNFSKDQYTEEEMAKRIRKLQKRITLMNGFDVLVAHAPAAGYGDLPDRPHQGFACFNDLMNRWHPKYMLNGHVHKCYGSEFRREREHPSGTKIINSYGSYMLEIRDDEHPAKGRTGSALYDLYISLTAGIGSA